MGNTRPFKITMHRARQLQRGEVMRPGVVGPDAATVALVRSESLALRREVVGPAYDWMTSPGVKDAVERALAKANESYDRYASALIDKQRALFAPPQPQGARDVRVCVGDTYRSCWGTGIVESVDGGFANMRRNGDGAIGLMALTEDGAVQYKWERISRAEPAQADDGAVRVGDRYSWSDHEGGSREWTVVGLETTAAENEIAFVTYPGRSSPARLKTSVLLAGEDAIGVKVTRVTRGPAP